MKKILVIIVGILLMGCATTGPDKNKAGVSVDVLFSIPIINKDFHYPMKTTGKIGGGDKTYCVVLLERVTGVEILANYSKEEQCYIIEGNETRIYWLETNQYDRVFKEWYPLFVFITGRPNTAALVKLVQILDVGKNILTN